MICRPNQLALCCDSKIAEPQTSLELGIHYDIRLFDELSWSQRLALVERVATHLFTPTSSALELTAIAEAAVAALFEHVSFEIDCEIDCEIDGEPPVSTKVRGLVASAYKACFAWEAATDGQDDDKVDGDYRGDGYESDGDYEGDDDYDDYDEGDEGYEVPSLDCNRRGAWRDLTEAMADRILWDRDYEMHGDFLDASPEKAAMFKSLLGIGDEYFAAAGPDIDSDDEVGSIYRRLAHIVAGGTANR